MLKGLLITATVIVGILAIDYYSILWTGITAPKREEVRRKVFENTKSYNEGKTQDLIRYMHEYKTAKTIEDKEAIETTIRHMFADYDENKLQPELRNFLKKIKYGE